MDDKEKILESLRKIKELFSDPERWIKYAFAKDKNYNITKPLSEDAYCFCLTGAIDYICKDTDDIYYQGHSYLRLIFSITVGKEYGNSIINWNDNPNTTHNDLLNLIDKTIEYERNR